MKGWNPRLIAVFPVLAISAAVVALNMWVIDHPRRLDLTSSGVYSIGPQTRKMLADLREPVHITFFYDLRSKEMSDARALLKQYADASPMIVLQMFDPAIAPAEARRYNVNFAGTMVFETNGRRIMVNGASETDITNGLIRVTSHGNQTLCFTEGHIEADPQSLSTHEHFEGSMGSGHSHSSGGRPLVLHERHGMGMARDALLTLGYKVRGVSLVSDAQVLNECSVVVIAAPQQRFEATEVERLRQWILTGGRIVALVDPFVDSGLDPVFAEFGVKLERRMIFDDESHYWTDASTPAVSLYPRHKITRNLPMTFFPGAASLAPLPAKGIDVKVVPLVQTSDSAHTEGIQTADTRKNEKKSDIGMQTIAVLATRTLASGNGKSSSIRRAELFLVSDGDFVTNSFFHILGNGALFLNAVGYLSEQEKLIDITPRNYELPRMQMTNKQMRSTFVLSTILLPGAALIFAVLAWWRRRR